MNTVEVPMKNFTKLTLALAISATLAACGGGSEDDDRYESNYDRDDVVTDNNSTNNSGNTVETDTSGYVSALITDNLSRDYAKVWVTLHEIEIVTASGSSALIYQSVGGTPVNLSELVDVSQLLGQQAVQAGTYTQFEVRLGNDINMVDSNGNIVNATFGSGVEQFEIVVNGNLVVTANTTSTLTLDFDLAQFVYDATTNRVSPTVLQFNDDSREQKAELQGQVTAVYSDRIEIQSSNHANTLTVNIGTGTVVYDESDRSSRNNTSAVVVGDYVEIYGDYDAATASIAAANVRIDSDNDSGEYRQDNDSYYEVEGRVVSYDGSTLVLDVREANFFPGASTVTVSGVANASFQTGIASDVNVGQWLEINGQWDGQTFTANYVEIEGGLTTEERESNAYNDGYLEVEGVITRVDTTAQQFVITVSDSDDGGFAYGTSVTVNYSGAWLNSYAQGCLLEGSFVEAKGALANNEVAAKRVEFKGACGSFSDYSYVDDSADERSDTYAENDNDNDNDNDNSASDNDDGYSNDDFDEAYGNEDHEAEGLIIALSDTQLTLRVSKVEGFAPGTTTIVVDITNAWYEDGSKATLALNRFIDVEGVWNGTVLVARKVEFD
jgi:hypothetical protein